MLKNSKGSDFRSHSKSMKSTDNISHSLKDFSLSKTRGDFSFSPRGVNVCLLGEEQKHGTVYVLKGRREKRPNTLRCLGYDL